MQALINYLHVEYEIITNNQKLKIMQVGNNWIYFYAVVNCMKALIWKSSYAYAFEYLEIKQ